MKARWGVGLTAILVLAVSSAQAEEVIDLDALAAEEVRSQAVTDRSKPEQVDIEVDVEAGEPSGPVVAGQMTEAAARAKKLFDHEWKRASRSARSRPRSSRSKEGRCARIRRSVGAVSGRVSHGHEVAIPDDCFQLGNGLIW